MTSARYACTCHKPECESCQRRVPAHELAPWRRAQLAPQPMLSLDDDTPLVCPMRKPGDDGECEACQ